MLKMYAVSCGPFLPESWTSDPARLARAGVPDDHAGYRSKPEIALAEIDRARTAGLRFGCVLADAGYGLSAPFRQALSARGLTWAVGIRARTDSGYERGQTGGKVNATRRQNAELDRSWGQRKPRWLAWYNHQRHHGSLDRRALDRALAGTTIRSHS